MTDDDKWYPLMPTQRKYLIEVRKNYDSGLTIFKAFTAILNKGHYDDIERDWMNINRTNFSKGTRYDTGN